MSSNHDLEPPSAQTNIHDRIIEGPGVSTFFLGTWTLASLISIAFAFISIRSRRGSLVTSMAWDLINTTSVLFVICTIVSVLVTHKVDEKRRGRGIRHVIKLRKPGVTTETNVISAIMARQAIHIAIALGLLVVIFQNDFLEPKNGVSALRDILSQFQTSVAWIVTGGFSLAVVTILVSALCYDYSCRFNWTPTYKSRLVRKGNKLDISSWYAFTVSLILSITLISPLLCIFINAGFGFLLLYYYFFDPKIVDAEAETVRGVSSPGTPMGCV